MLKISINGVFYTKFHFHKGYIFYSNALELLILGQSFSDHLLKFRNLWDFIWSRKHQFVVSLRNTYTAQILTHLSLLFFILCGNQNPPYPFIVFFKFHSPQAIKSVWLQSENLTLYTYEGLKYLKKYIFRLQRYWKLKFGVS